MTTSLTLLRSSLEDPTPQSIQQLQQSQQQFMESDTVLVTDIHDNILPPNPADDDGTSSKKATHTFSTLHPHGILHRAFSVFLFDASTSELLLQQRASTKITFPNVWTNTCCSHPLRGMDPPESELDFGTGVPMRTMSMGGEHNDNHRNCLKEKMMENERRDLAVRGIMNAAFRKLYHELGIPPTELLPSRGVRFQYLTRVHYWAADTITHGPFSRWGEQEIDYILFVTVPDKRGLTLTNLNDDEVGGVRWVNPSQLRTMFNDKELLFSPWFRIIADRWLLGSGHGDGGGGGERGGWWNDLERTMSTNDYCDHTKIHRFDPSPEHMGGAGNAGPLFLD